MELLKFSGNNYCDLEHRLPHTTVKQFAQSLISISSANSRGAQQELDESDLWLELLADSGVIKSRLIQPLRQETDELIAIFVTMTKNVKKRQRPTG